MRVCHKAKASISVPQGRRERFSGMFSTIRLYMKVELSSNYAVVSDVVPCMICLIYAPRNMQAVGEILLHRLKISRKV